jgi:hypothetical protein
VEDNEGNNCWGEGWEHRNEVFRVGKAGKLKVMWMKGGFHTIKVVPYECVAWMESSDGWSSCHWLFIWTVKS